MRPRVHDDVAALENARRRRGRHAHDLAALCPRAEVAAVGHFGDEAVEDTRRRVVQYGHSP